MSDARYYVLFRDGGQIQAALGPPAVNDKWPASIVIRGIEYLPLDEEDRFFFWDELVDKSGATVAYQFLLPESPTFRESRFVRESSNVSIEVYAGYHEIQIHLQPCLDPEFVCVQGFGSQIYARTDDRRDCILYVFDWSENRIAFPLCSLEA